MSSTWRTIDDTATLGECEQVIVRAVWERFSSECYTIGTEVFGELCLDNSDLTLECYDTRWHHIMPSTKWQSIESIEDAPIRKYILYRYNYRDNNEVWRYDIVRKRLDRNDFSRNVDTIEWMVLEDNLKESGQWQ
jgi:hypothetical protein